MGCSSSTDGFPTKQSRKKKDLIDTTNEKINEDLTIPERNYPRPRPPRDKKSHIYTPGGYSDLETNAKNATYDICVSWHPFVKYLTQGMTTDIEKVRSLFVWMGSQNFRSGKIPSGKENSPLSYMKKVQKKSISYATFFVKICRAVGLKAVVIKGIAKSVAYDVGDSVEDLQNLRNSWAAVYVNGDWRLIFTLWAFSAVEGRTNDKYTLVDVGHVVNTYVQRITFTVDTANIPTSPTVNVIGYKCLANCTRNYNLDYKCYTCIATRKCNRITNAGGITFKGSTNVSGCTLAGGKTKNTAKVSPGSAVTKFNEFFFLTDPDIFIHFAFPENDDWQLTLVPLTLQNFVEEPFYRQPYFKNKLHCVTPFHGVHKAKRGVVEVGMKSLTENWQGELKYQLFFNKKESGPVKLPNKTQLPNYVIMNRNDGNWKFVVRFPVNGVYKLTINGGVSPNNNKWICDFKLVCDSAYEDVLPLPCDTGSVGWGPGNELQTFGLIEPSQPYGTILAKLRQQIYVCFKLTKKILIRSELVANKYKVEDLTDNISQRIANRELVVTVTVPGDGEYALRMFAREKKSLPEENVCNYLITTDDPKGPKTYRKENAFEKNLRRELVIKTQESKDPGEIGKAIEKFDRLALEDKGDLRRAKNRQEFLEVRKALVDATVRRHHSTLDDAMVKARTSKFQPKLKNTMKKAETIRQEVDNERNHEILEMKQSTVAELKGYRYPPPAIFDSMRAVYLLLGEKEENLKIWEDVQLLLSHLGNDSILNRINNLNSTEITEVALTEADNLTKTHDLANINQNSPAAGVFYGWVRDTVQMVQHNRATPPKKKGMFSKNKKT